MVITSLSALSIELLLNEKTEFKSNENRKNKKGSQ